MTKDKCSKCGSLKDVRSKLCRVCAFPGRYKHKANGYIYILVNEILPSGKHKHIAEHRVIMEKLLGRKLEPQEEVDHINGVRDDNRPENLRLMKNKGMHQKIHKPKGYNKGPLAVGWIDGRSLVQKNCKFCGKKFLPTSRKKGEGLYCSKICAYKGRTIPRNKCLICGKPSPRARRKFCSNPCYQIYRIQKDS